MKDNYYVSILLPSRGRPSRLTLLLESIKKTTKFLKFIEVIIRIDFDEKEIYENIKITDLNYEFIYGPSDMKMGQLNNDCLKMASGQNVFIVNDDVIFKTKNWDLILKKKVEALNSKIFLMYPDDGFKKQKLSTFPILNREILLQNPNMLPISYKGSFIDTHLMDIFMEYNHGKNIFFLKDILCKHYHFRKDKKLLDNTYLKRDRFGDDKNFINFSLKRKKIASKFNGQNLENSKNKELSIFYLLNGQSKLIWRLYLFTYLYARRIYSSIFKIKKFIN